jgi:hypothetical protein
LPAMRALLRFQKASLSEMHEERHEHPLGKRTGMDTGRL